jgi:ankyrin repeat protein
MSADSPGVPRSLPARPHLRHLKDQAKDLLKAGDVASIAEAQSKIARLYGFASWPKLKAHVDSLEEIGQLKQAIDSNDLERVKTLMTRNPPLHRAPLGYNKNGPLTWVAECRVPWVPPGPERLAIAEWMIDHGSDVHQGGDGPLMRAALFGHRIAMMELLVSRGADVNALWNGYFPIIFAPCETVEPVPLKWLLEHGANPNCADPQRKYPGTALDYVIGTYGRSEQLGACIDILFGAGGVTKYNIPAVLNLLRNRLEVLAENVDAEPTLLHRRFIELDFGSTSARRLKLEGATLLHVAAEYNSVGAAKLLLDRGADVNARASLDESGIGGQTPIFHAVTQFGDHGWPVAQLLIDRGADLSVRVRLPGHYERPDETVECTPLGYALLFPGREDHSPTHVASAETRIVSLLRAQGAVE